MAKSATEKTSAAALDDARAAALGKFIKDMNAKDAGAVFTEFTNPLEVESISTGALSLDYALGVGGLPRGRVVELYGPEHSGKTTLALSVCANAIRNGGVAGFVDVENAINFEHVRWMGVDTHYFAVSQPESGEEALQKVEAMCEEGIFHVVVLDSVAALVPKRELEGEIGDPSMALLGRLMSEGLRKLVGIAHRTNTTIIFINQLREKPGVTMGNPEYTPGGRALKFFSSVRLEVRARQGEYITEGSGENKKILGQVCRVSVKKNKVAAPFKTAQYRLLYGQGIDSSAAIVDVAVATGVWYTRPGGLYFDATTGEQIGRGKESMQVKLSSDPVLAEEVRIKVVEQMRSAQPSEPIVEDASDDSFDGFDEAGATT